MSHATGKWKSRGWGKRWMDRRDELEKRQEAGEWINCDANCYCCRYMVDEGCIETEDDANENCPAPGPTPAAAPAPTTASTTVGASSAASSITASPTTVPASGIAASSSSSVAQEWVFPAATGSIRARQAGAVDTAAFGPVYREDSMIVQWTPEDTTPGIQWFCESDAGSELQQSYKAVHSIVSQTNTGTTDDVYCRLGFTDAPGQTVQWQYINTPNVEGANVISAPANVATAAVATATSVLSSATSTISTSPTSTSGNNPGGGGRGGGGGGLSTAGAAGVGVGVAVIVIAAIILGGFLWRRSKNKRPRSTPVWAAGTKEPSNSDDSSQPAYYSDDRKVANGVYELPGAPVNPTELPAGIKGTAAMPCELDQNNEEMKAGIAELGSDKDLEEQHITPRPLAPNTAALRVKDDDDGIGSRLENGTFRSAISPNSGTLNSETPGTVSQVIQSDSGG